MKHAFFIINSKDKHTAKCHTKPQHNKEINFWYAALHDLSFMISCNKNTMFQTYEANMTVIVINTYFAIISKYDQNDFVNFCIGLSLQQNRNIANLY